MRHHCGDDERSMRQVGQAGDT